MGHQQRPAQFCTRWAPACGILIHTEDVQQCISGFQAPCGFKVPALLACPGNQCVENAPFCRLQPVASCFCLWRQRRLFGAVATAATASGKCMGAHSGAFLQNDTSTRESRGTTNVALQMVQPCLCCPLKTFLLHPLMVSTQANPCSKFCCLAKRMCALPHSHAHSTSTHCCMGKCHQPLTCTRLTLVCHVYLQTHPKHGLRIT